MSKELIERLRTETFPDLILLDDAADRIMELERELRVKDATIGQMANDMQAAQKRIDDLERSLKSEERLSFRHQLEESQAREALQQKRIEQQQSWITALEQNARDADRMYAELETELAAAQAEIAHWKNNHETEVRRARILKERTDMPIERVQAYEKWGEDQRTLAEQQKRIEEAEHQMHVAIQEHFDMEQQLAASQAQINVMRDALESIGNGFHESHQVHAVIKHALSQPTDDSALRELLKAERERLSGQVGSIGKFCKSEYDCIDQGIDFAAYEIGLIDSIEAVRRLLEKSNG